MPSPPTTSQNVKKQVVHYLLVPGAFSYSPGMHAFAL